MKQIKNFKKIFANGLLFLLLAFVLQGSFPLAASAQSAFPLTIATDTSKANTLRVKLTNNAQVAYTTRVIVTDQTDSTKKFVVQADKYITPGATEILTYEPTINNHQYFVKILTATDNPATSATKFTEKTVTAYGRGTDTPNSTNATNPNSTDPAVDPAAQAGNLIQCKAEGAGPNSCNDDKDNDGDCRADWDGVVRADGTALPPDPACVNKNSVEVADGNCSDLKDNDGDGKVDAADSDCNTGKLEGSIIPCENKCDLSSAMLFLNNIISFALRTIFLPLLIIMFIYAGYTYITAQGNPSKKVNVKKMIGHVILGMVIILCAWLIVRTALVVLGYADSLLFFE